MTTKKLEELTSSAFQELIKNVRKSYAHVQKEHNDKRKKARG